MFSVVSEQHPVTSNCHAWQMADCSIHWVCRVEHEALLSNFQSLFI